MFALGNFSNESLIWLVAIAGITTFLMLRTQRRMGRRREEPLPSARQQPARRPGGYDVRTPPEVERWEVRMHELARELSATIDTKAAALQYLVEQAETQIARLESMTRDAAAAKSPPQASVAAFQPAARAGDPRYERIYALADAGQSHQAIAAAVGSPVGEVELILGLRSK